MSKYKINFKIVIPILLMAIVSIITIYSALTYTSKSLGNLALKQAIWYIVGFILVFILLRLFIQACLVFIYYRKCVTSLVVAVCYTY